MQEGKREKAANILLYAALNYISGKSCVYLFVGSNYFYGTVVKYRL